MQNFLDESFKMFPKQNLNKYFSYWSDLATSTFYNGQYIKPKTFNLNVIHNQRA